MIYTLGSRLSIQLVHCSDIHLDKNFNYGDLQRSDQRRKDIENNFEKIVEFTLKEKPDLFLISGDIFDKVNPSNSSRSFLVKQIRSIHEAGILAFLIGGNHDVPKMGLQILAIDILESAGLATVFSDSTNFQEKTIKDIDTQIVGKSFFTKNQNQNPFQNFNIKKKAKYQVCLIHGSLLGMNVSTPNPHDSQYNPFGTTDINSSIDYLALGHYHNNFERDTSTTKICNPGSIDCLNWSESQDQKGFAFVELNNENRQISFISLETRKFQTKEISLDRSISDVNDYIINQIKDDANSDEIIKIIVKGIISQEQQKTFKISNLARDVNKLYFHADFDFPLEIENIGRIFLGKIENPIEAFEKHFDNQLEKTQDEQEREFLQKAKQLGIQYLGVQNDN